MGRGVCMHARVRAQVSMGRYMCVFVCARAIFCFMGRGMRIRIRIRIRIRMRVRIRLRISFQTRLNKYVLCIGSAD